MYITNLTVAILVGAISYTEAINIRQDTVEATAPVTDVPVPDDAQVIISPENTVLENVIDETPTERSTVQGDDSALTEHVDSFGQDGEVYGVCTSVSHPFAIPAA